MIAYMKLRKEGSIMMTREQACDILQKHYNLSRTNYQIQTTQKDDYEEALYIAINVLDSVNQLMKMEVKEAEEELNERARYITDISDVQQKRIDSIRKTFSTMYYSIEKLCKPNRETSLAFTKLEEAQYWAIKGISRETVKS